MNYKTWLQEWLENYVKPIRKRQTYKKYKCQIERHISPTLGDFEINEISAFELQKFMSGLCKSGFASNTINGIVTVLKMSLKQAVKHKIATVQFTEAIVRPKVREKKVECFTKKDQAKIQEYISSKNDTKLYGIVLCMYTGLRIGELLALTWEDFDFSKRTVTVSKSCHDEWINGEYIKVIDTPKTEKSERTIPIPKQLLPLLKEWKKQSVSKYIVSGKSKIGVKVRCYQNTFELMLKRLNIPHKGFHALRHTFATRALECGMDIRTLADILGHDDPTVTLKRYAHSMFEHKTEMMNRVGKLFP